MKRFLAGFALGLMFAGAAGAATMEEHVEAFIKDMKQDECVEVQDDGLT